MKHLPPLASSLLSVCIKVTSAQSDNKELALGYYVVVGAYVETKEVYASRFVGIIN